MVVNAEVVTIISDRKNLSDSIFFERATEPIQPLWRCARLRSPQFYINFDITKYKHFVEKISWRNNKNLISPRLWMCFFTHFKAILWSRVPQFPMTPSSFSNSELWANPKIPNRYGTWTVIKFCRSARTVPWESWNWLEPEIIFLIMSQQF